LACHRPNTEASSGSGAALRSYGSAARPTVWRVVDAIFAERRLAEVYDPLDPDRSDLDAYAAMVDEFGARSVLDIGCGTGTFACLLARRGLTVTAVDPAAASLAVARTKPGADRVRWVHGYATDLPPLQVDLVTMTANVAQVFVTDAEWASTLRAAYAALRPGERLVFETGDPAARAWLEWNRERSYQRTVVPEVGGVQAWHELLDMRGELVWFRSTVVFESDGAVLTSESTLRFRHRDEVTASLAAAGYVVDQVRQAPDRPGRELVFIARRADVGSTGTWPRPAPRGC
jgi:SAM-dependent methyltransferase